MSPSSPSAGYRASPIVMPTSALRPLPSSKRCSTMPCSRCAAAASCSRAQRGSRPSNTMANSSPPSRATMSLRRRARPKRCATSCSSASPASWPHMSLTGLKSSRSTTPTASASPLRAARASASGSCCSSARRFGNPVIESWVARCSKRCCIAWRSVTSRKAHTEVDGSRVCASPTILPARSAMSVAPSRRRIRTPWMNALP
ncbi:hypothetical protein GALL_507610 [mine drainage metagenome]|uniref:Uncharacterized protein n=1 Tax=mine drainage metagenome TaxID=410659 RepID=A0A1J5PQU3_9ZZZZ